MNVPFRNNSAVRLSSRQSCCAARQTPAPHRYIEQRTLSALSRDCATCRVDTTVRRHMYSGPSAVGSRNPHNGKRMRRETAPSSRGSTAAYPRRHYGRDRSPARPAGLARHLALVMDRRKGDLQPLTSRTPPHQ
jgi:hypothetical protein